MFFIAIAQLLIIAHAIIPHHHHDQFQADQACSHFNYHSEDSMNAQFEGNHDTDDCRADCSLNVIISQINVDYHFIQVENEFDLVVTDYQQLFYTNSDTRIVSPHLLRHHLRAPPQA